MNQLEEKIKINYKSYKLDVKSEKFDPEYFAYYNMKAHILNRILFVNKNLDIILDIYKFWKLLNILPNPYYSILYTVAYNRLLDNMEKLSGEALNINVCRLIQYLPFATIYQIYKDENVYTKNIDLLIQCLQRMANHTKDLVENVEITRGAVKPDLSIAEHLAGQN